MQREADLEAADAQWVRSGGPLQPGYHSQRTTHNLRLAYLGISHRIQELSSAGTAPPRAPAPEEVESSDTTGDPIVAFGPSEQLHPAGEAGFRRLREAFASQDDCLRVRAATTVAMVKVCLHRTITRPPCPHPHLCVACPFRIAGFPARRADDPLVGSCREGEARRLWR